MRDFTAVNSRESTWKHTARKHSRNPRPASTDVFFLQSRTYRVEDLRSLDICPSGSHEPCCIAFTPENAVRRICVDRTGRMREEKGGEGEKRRGTRRSLRARVSGEHMKIFLGKPKTETRAGLSSSSPREGCRRFSVTSEIADISQWLLLLLLFFFFLSYFIFFLFYCYLLHLARDGDETNLYRYFWCLITVRCFVKAGYTWLLLHHQSVFKEFQHYQSLSPHLFIHAKHLRNL